MFVGTQNSKISSLICSCDTGSSSKEKWPQPHLTIVTVAMTTFCQLSALFLFLTSFQFDQCPVAATLQNLQQPRAEMDMIDVVQQHRDDRTGYTAERRPTDGLTELKRDGGHSLANRFTCIDLCWIVLTHLNAALWRCISADLQFFNGTS